MNKSNNDVLSLSHEQAGWLVQLFAPSFDGCLQNVVNKEKPFIWYPVLRDIHRQTVHELPPVLVEPRQRPGESNPAISLSLLPVYDESARLQGRQELQNVPDSLTPGVKPAL